MKTMVALLGLLTVVTSCNTEEKQLQEEYVRLSEKYSTYLDTVRLESGVIDTALVNMEARLQILEVKLATK